MIFYWTVSLIGILYIYSHLNQLTFFQSSVKKRKEDDFKMIAYAYEYHNNKVKCDDLDLAFFFQ